MAVTITLKNNNGLLPIEEDWLLKHIGPRLHYTHQSVGGEGWICKRVFKPGMVGVYYNLTIEDDRYATWFILHFPQ